MFRDEEDSDGIILRRHIVVTSNDGWLSPDGFFYPCQWMQHSRTIAAASGMNAVTAEELGWIKLDSMYGLISSGDRDPTQTQINMLYDWYMSNGTELPWQLKEWMEKKL